MKTDRKRDRKPDRKPGPGRTPVPVLLAELKDLVIGYARQETLDPVKGLARYLAFGMAGSTALALGAALGALAGLRALQTETGTVFTGHWSWAPYGICAGGALLLAVSAGYAAARRPRRSRRT